jgi:two-component system nitrogen regulation response regulator NtrX
MPQRILIVDDERGIREALTLLLEDAGYDPLGAEGGAAALDVIGREEISLVLCDVAMPGMDGITLVERLNQQRPELPVVMISAHGELETAVRAVRAGAYDYLVKPIDEKRLFHTITRALEYQRVRSDYRLLRQEAASEQEMIGESPPMERLREEIRRAAPSEARVLILGENGTGKELVARLIHELSRRSERPFVKVNSAAIPKDLIESELFGHEAGAFTGALKARRGKFELAEGGTLFLDEVCDMAMEAQAKLLRVLSTGELERVGGARPIPFDVRLLSASNRDLNEEIEEGAFREDLYHRIAVIPIRVPALRERGRDVEILAERFLGQYSAGYRRSPPNLEGEARRALRRYTWPGNVRELRNLMERIAIMHEGETISGRELEELLARPVLKMAEAAPPQAAAAGGEGIASRWKSRVKDEERSLVEQTLREAGWSVTLAAERLGIDRASLHRKMRRLGIQRPGRGPESPPTGREP